ncbi:MAG: hypothetical protein A2Z88_02845 [Omnitrophica WOR_2 bacterium GWA2_47_8]|nr:MAG: hypothetical protein A2Z88_02845 [Omnitrophica WOR_2 bacterium GWA2_47_8]
MAKKILLVDDDRMVTTILFLRLDKMGYDVKIADDGQIALNLAQQETPDLIILDIQMPNMNGYTFITELQKIEECQHIPIIVLTSRDDMAPIFQAKGVAGYFTKPFNTDQVMHKIEECLK